MTETVVNTGPLAGIRVLDLSSVIMGPYATQILADLGADVICVEELAGDTNRIMGPSPWLGMSGVAVNLLRNKRNICLDLKHADGRDACLRIAATCDVVVTNLRPAPLARLGLGYEVIREARPDVVMCQACGWPADSPDADRPAYDDVIQATSGVAAAFTLQNGLPALAPTLVADKVSGLTIVYSIIAALFHRQRTGEGQFIEVPMNDVLTAFNLVEHGSAAIPVPAHGAAGYPRILAADRRPFATLDGWIAVLPYSEANYADIFREGGRSDLAGDPRLISKRERNVHAASLYSDVAPIIGTRTTAFWSDFCRVHDIPAGVVRSLDDLVDELPVVEHPTLGPYHAIPQPVRFSATPSSLRRHASLLGQDGREVLREVGFDDARIEQLVQAGALRALPPG